MQKSETYPHKKINTLLLNDLIRTYDICGIEKHLFYVYLENTKTAYSKNALFKKYFRNFSCDQKLFSKISDLNITTLNTLANYLEQLIPPTDRKLKGAFFTPSYIIDFIIDEIHPGKNETNLDPGCGCGNFLVRIAEYYRKKHSKTIRRTLRENIFGADISYDNIHRAKLLLSVLGLQYDEDIAEADFNLMVADSLRADWKHCFKKTKGKFDNILGNPPYIKFQNLSDDNRQYLRQHWHETIRDGTFNIYFAFFELGYKLLKKNGKLGYITPNNYFTSLAGKSLRKFFHEHQCVRKIIDFDCKKIFNAQTYTAITFLNKKRNQIIYFDKISKNQTPAAFLKNIHASPNSLDKLNFRKWRLLKSDDQKNIEHIENMGTPIKELFDIHVGIATLKDELYFIDNRLEKNGYFLKFFDDKIFEIEKEITKSIYKISDFQNQTQCNNNTRKIIFPYHIIDGKSFPLTEMEMKAIYPKTYQYFLYISPLLKKRDKGKTDFKPFYAYGRTQGLARTGKKIITPGFSQYPRFMAVEEEEAFFCNGYGLYVREKQKNQAGEMLKNPLPAASYISIAKKILNSYVMHYYVSKTSVSIAGGYPCYQKNFIEKFTFPDFSNDELAILNRLDDAAAINGFLIDKYHLNLSMPDDSGNF